MVFWHWVGGAECFSFVDGTHVFCEGVRAREGAVAFCVLLLAMCGPSFLATHAPYQVNCNKMVFRVCDFSYVPSARTHWHVRSPSCYSPPTRSYISSVAPGYAHHVDVEPADPCFL